MRSVIYILSKREPPKIHSDQPFSVGYTLRNVYKPTARGFSREETKKKKRTRHERSRAKGEMSTSVERVKNRQIHFNGPDNAHRRTHAFVSSSNSERNRINTEGNFIWTPTYARFSLLPSFSSNSRKNALDETFRDAISGDTKNTQTLQEKCLPRLTSFSSLEKYLHRVCDRRVDKYYRASCCFWKVNSKEWSKNVNNL